MKIANRHYHIEPHPKGGFYGIEFIGNKKTGWQSENHSDLELVQTRINKRKSFLQGDYKAPVSYDYGHYKSMQKNRKKGNIANIQKNAKGKTNVKN